MYIYMIWLNVCIISYMKKKRKKAKNLSFIEKMPKTKSKIDYESSESEYSFFGDHDSYDDELDDSSEEVDEENVEIDDEMSVEEVEENDINEYGLCVPKIH